MAVHYRFSCERCATLLGSEVTVECRSVTCPHCGWKFLAPVWDPILQAQQERAWKYTGRRGFSRLTTMHPLAALPVVGLFMSLFMILPWMLFFLGTLVVGLIAAGMAERLRDRFRRWRAQRR